MYSAVDVIVDVVVVVGGKKSKVKTNDDASGSSSKSDATLNLGFRELHARVTWIGLKRQQMRSSLTSAMTDVACLL
jgi:hypothetical protein